MTRRIGIAYQDVTYHCEQTDDKIVLKSITLPKTGWNMIVEGEVTMEGIPANSVGSREVQDESLNERDLDQTTRAGLHELENEEVYASSDHIRQLFENLDT